MKRQILLFIGLIFFAANFNFAQTKTVTNADLERFRQIRLAAERDYRENYEKLGFPSPEELKARIEQDRIEREELASRLQAERLQREALRQEQMQTELLLAQNEYLRSLDTNSNNRSSVYVTGYPGYGYNNYPGYYGRRYKRGSYLPYILPRPIRPFKHFSNGGIRYVHENSFIRVERPPVSPRFGGRRY